MDYVTHEIIHGYFTEAGLPDYSSDERLVEWIAQLLPRITKTVETAKNIVEGQHDNKHNV